jgi:hypothetical protein
LSLNSKVSNYSYDKKDNFFHDTLFSWSKLQIVNSSNVNLILNERLFCLTFRFDS